MNEAEAKKKLEDAAIGIAIKHMHTREAGGAKAIVDAAVEYAQALLAAARVPVKGLTHHGPTMPHPGPSNQPLACALTADELAKIAGWTVTEHTTQCSKDVHVSGSIPVRVWSRNGCELVTHPFPVSLVDPLLKHIREVLEPKGWHVNSITDASPFMSSRNPTFFASLRRNTDSHTITEKGPSFWSALARTILAAHEVEGKNVPNS